MKLRDPRLIRVAAYLAACLIRVWIASLRVRVRSLDGLDHPLDARRTRFIYAFWHDSLLVPIRFRSRAALRVLISKHADGELIAQVCRHLGMGTVRGSSTRGGGSALVQLWHCQEPAHLIFHPDGPRGPRRRVQVGMVALASKTGLAVVPVGIGHRSAWHARSWDRFALPRPFSLCVAVVAEPIAVPPDLDRAGLDAFRKLAEDRMLEATEAAERWAAGGEVVLKGPHRPPPAAHSHPAEGLTKAADS